MTTLQQAALDTDTRLETLLDRLTRPHTTEIRDAGRTLGWRTDPPLIHQLRTAIHTAQSATAEPGDGGALAKHERVTLNTGAVKLYTTIERRTRTWALDAGYTRHHGTWPTPERILTAWWALAKHDIDPRPYTNQLQAWATQISELLDPPHRFDIDKPCPVCKAHIIDIRSDNGDQKRARALTGLERDPDLHRVTCRNCDTQWDGLEAAQELADELAEP